MKITPKKAISDKQIIKMKSDNFSTKDAWIMNNGSTISLAQQRNGHEAKGIIRISKLQFEKLIKWYNTPQSI